MSRAYGYCPNLMDSHRHSCHYCLGALLDEAIQEKRPAIITQLKAKGIGSSVYYPQPVPRMTYYRKKYGYDESHYPNAARISDGLIALPVGPHLQPEQMVTIADGLRAILMG
jgi:perosamine synthetase